MIFIQLILFFISVVFTYQRQKMYDLHNLSYLVSCCWGTPPSKTLLSWSWTPLSLLWRCCWDARAACCWSGGEQSSARRWGRMIWRSWCWALLLARDLVSALCSGVAAVASESLLLTCDVSIPAPLTRHNSPSQSILSTQGFIHLCNQTRSLIFRNHVPMFWCWNHIILTII